MTKLLNMEIKKEFLKLLNNATKNIRIISPFIGYETAKLFAENISQNISTTLITRFNRTDFSYGSSSLLGLKELIKNNVNMFAIKKLHTKLYIFDSRSIIIGSSNFTTGGFETNIELNILIENEPIIINSAIDYFNEMKTSISDEYRITASKIDEEIELIGNKKNTRFDDRFGDFGQELSIKSIEDDLEKSLKQNLQDTSAWIKFEGYSDRRREDGNKLLNVNIKDDMYTTSFPKNNKPTGLKTGDVVFIARHSFDKNGEKTPIVYGYGIVREFDEKNVMSKEEQESNENYRRWPYYIYVETFKYIQKNLNEGITFNQIYKDIGNTFFPRSLESDKYEDFVHKYSQSSHLRITDTGKNYLMNKLNEII